MIYYVSAAIISILSLFSLFANNSLNDLESLIVSFMISLLPLVIDSLLFLEDTRYKKQNKAFKILRILNGILIFFISFIFILVIFLRIIPILQQTEKNGIIYLCLCIDKWFGKFNADVEKTFSNIFSIKTVSIYYAMVFVISVFVRLFSNVIKKKASTKSNDNNDNTKNSSN